MIVIDLLTTYSKLYPAIWNKLEIAHKQFIKQHELEDEWPSWCHAPLSEATSIVTKGLSKISPDMLSPEEESELEVGTAQANVINALALWRRSKEVFHFDETLETTLTDQRLEKIPGEIIRKIPYPCVYIKLNDTMFENQGLIEFES